MLLNQTLIESTITDLTNDIAPIWLGDAGIGKSSAAADVAEKMDAHFFSLACNTLADRADLTGARLVPNFVTALDEDGNEILNDDGTVKTVQSTGSPYKQMFFPHDVMVKALETAWANPNELVIVFLDEVNRVSSDITSAILTLFTDKVFGSYKIPANMRFIAAGNDGSNNVVAFDEAATSRFHLYRVEPDAETFQKVMADKGLHRWIVQVLTEHPEYIFSKGSARAVETSGDGRSDDDDEDLFIATDAMLDEATQMLQIATPRTIEYLNRWLNATPEDKIKEYFVENSDSGISSLQEILEGLTGNTPFTNEVFQKISMWVASSVSSAPTNTFVPPKPTGYDTIVNANSVTDMEDALTNIAINADGSQELTKYLVYAIDDKADRSLLIDKIFYVMDSQNLIVDNTQVPSIMRMFTNKTHNQHNLDKAMSTNYASASTFNALSAFLSSDGNNA